MQTRPTVERKIAHLTRREHGGRRARVRGSTKVTADFAPPAANNNPLERPNHPSGPTPTYSRVAIRPR